MKRSTVMIGAGLLIVGLAAAGGYALVGRGGGKPVITETPEAAKLRAERCAVIKSSVTDAGFASRVSINCDDWQAHLVSDSYPDHDLMNGIVGTNEQVPVPAIKHSAPIVLEPRLTKQPKTRDSSLAVAVNGVPIFDYTAGGEMSVEDLKHHRAEHDTLLRKELDHCGGHAGKGDDYHYHKTPTCMIDQMMNKGDAAIIGWAFDGYPVYGKNNPDGTAIAKEDLDVCNGQADRVFGYRYHASDAVPYIIQCLMGEVPSRRDLPRIAPLRPVDGRPPRGGVEGLTFTQDANGQRRMDYTFKGQSYYIHYKPADAPGCYQFETRTVTDDGVVKKGEYCR